MKKIEGVEHSDEILTTNISGSVRTLRPEGARRSTPNCWIRVWEHTGFQGRSMRIEGPMEIPWMGDWEWPDGGGDMHDDIGSIVVGPQAWFIGYEDEHFGDTQVCLGPGSSIPDLGRFNMNDQIDSFKIFDSRPEEWPGNSFLAE